MKWSSKIPTQLRSLFLQMAFVLLLLSVTRLVFYFLNSQSFQSITFYDFLVGFWFDCVTVGLVFLPYVAFFMLPLPIRKFKWHKLISLVLFVVTCLLCVGLNLGDSEYFKYTSKRSTIDLIAILSAGSDIKQLALAFLTDFWYLILLFIGFTYAVIRFYRWTIKADFKEENWSRSFVRVAAVSFLFSIGMCVFIGRGGFVFKPVGVLDASRFVDNSKTSLVLNTPFTMIKSFGNQSLKELDYYSSIAETEKYFNPVQESQPQNLFEGKPNVVVLILESFGKEFIGYYNGEKSHTPFLDSILRESMTFSMGLANGKKSIEALPSIFAGMPSLQDNPYISSQYNSNRIIGLPEMMRRFGYESAFYHGATNGSMRFDAFSKLIGFDHYVGRTEYGNEQHADESWGILDEYFNPWVAKQISNLKEPFLASLFTLSSHHPYFIPSHRKDEVKYGSQPLAASISYGDLSLKLFFEEAKKQPWFNNTIFVICADHTPGSITPFFNLQTQLYQIPLAFYSPNGKFEKGKKEMIFQQIDIYPTILDLINVKTSFYSFGQSIFVNKPRFGVSYLEGNYYYFQDNNLLIFADNEARNLYDLHSTSPALENVIADHKKEVVDYERVLKAVIQRYNHDLIRNKTTAIK